MTSPVELSPNPEDHIQPLLEKHTEAQKGLDENNLYYDSKRRPKSVGLAVPPEMRELLAEIGWPRLYIDSLEARLDIEGFRLPGQPTADEEIWSWWQANRLDVMSSFGTTEALVHGVAYITVAMPDGTDPLWDPTVPLIGVEGPDTMFAEQDRRTGRVTRAIRVIVGEDGQVEYVTIYLPDTTAGYFVESGSYVLDFSVTHGLGVVPVVPLVNRFRLADRLGQSEIKAELRSATDAAARTMMNMQATSELMAIPQRLLFGVKPEELGVADPDPDDENEVDPTLRARSTYAAYIARILAFEDPEAKAQQFTAAELRNFTEVLDKLAQLAASYTGLPPQYLSITSDNPASAEAIKASESRLIKMAERKQRVFGDAWEMAMRIAYLAAKSAPPKGAIETVWRDPSTPTYAAKADAVVKLATAVTADGRPIIPVERARIDIGYSEAERVQMEEWDKNSPTGQLAALVGNRPGLKAVPSGKGAQEAS